MAIDSTKLNFFAQAYSMQGIGATKAVGGGGAAGGVSTGVAGGSAYSNKQGANYVGINQNIKQGDSMFIGAQAGKSAGVGHSRWIA